VVGTDLSNSFGDTTSEALMRWSQASGAVLVIAIIFSAQSAVAQWNNAPYQGRGGDTGVGMSDAYRQAILYQRERGRPDGQIYRAPSGELLILERGRGNQVVVVGVDDVPVVAPRRGSRMSRGQGFGYGGRDGYGTRRQVSFTSRHYGGLPASSSALAMSQQKASEDRSPIDIWTSQLNAMGD
jgi:hypothetical protein